MRRSLSFLLVALMLTACSIRDPGDNGDDALRNQGGVAAIESAGWENVIIQDVVNLVLTVKLRNTGHYETNRRACPPNMADFGALNLEDWNRVARLLNTAVAQGERPEEYCVPITHAPVGLSGTVTATLNGGKKRPLMSIRIGASGREACTKIDDRQIAQDLANALNRVSILAAYQGCSNPPDNPPMS